MNVFCRVGEWGFVHTIKTGIDHSAAFSEAKIHYRDPDGAVVAKTCDVVDSAKGEYGWTVATPGFDQAGKWEAQLVLDLGASGIRKLRTPIVFLVGESGVS